MTIFTLSRRTSGAVGDITELGNTILRRLTGVLLPLAVLAAAAAIVPRVNLLPPSLAGLRSWGPTVLILAAASLALAFNRGRVLFAVAALAAGFAGYKLLGTPQWTGFPARTVFAAICIFVPLNLIGLCLLRERGIFNQYGIRRIGIIAAQAGLTAWVVAGNRTALTDLAYHTLLSSQTLGASPIPQAGLTLMVAGAAAALGAAVWRHSSIDGGFAGAIAAVLLACQNIATPNAFPVFFGAAALILGVAVLQDTFRLAFRDELTGLRSRRALDERLMSLGGQYSLAMVDIDHFKELNDRHGHQVGDQVLRMVASKLQAAGRGGRAYRYGGEEFTLVFPGKGVREAWSTLEAMRRDIAQYALTIRARNRPAQQEAVHTVRTGQPNGHSVSVTISIGVAERNGRPCTPSEVLRAADEALYRAKHKGRNQVSR